MINSVNSNPSFGSTFIPMKKNMPVCKFFGNLNDYFKVKWIDCKPVQQAADEIHHGQAAFMMNDKGITLVGKDGGADAFLGKIMKKIHPDAKFTDDIKPSIIKGSAIDLNI